MKKRNLLIGIALATGFLAQAVESPYTGSVVGEGTYYLYQVETGLWLQSNRQNIDQWTTQATLDDVGFDVQIIKPENYEGYQIFCRFTNNGSLNGADEDRFFLDQPDRDITDWIFEPTEVEGVSNAYKIMAKATPDGTAQRSVILEDFYIGAADGMLSDNPTDFTWQLVSREERIAKMVADAANGPVDASWLIPWNDRGRNDLRDQEWVRNNVRNDGGDGFDGAMGYPVREAWHNALVSESITLTDIPNGTYQFYVQAYYRDGEEGSIIDGLPDDIRNSLGQRYLDGEEVSRAFYYAGAKKEAVMSIFANAKDAEQDGFHCNIPNAAKWLPGSMEEAAVAMFAGEYINEPIEASVSDGTLTLGIEKVEWAHRDWLIFKRFYLKYVNADVQAEDLSALQSELSALISEAKELPQTPTFVDFIATAENALATAQSSSALLQAINEIKGAISVIEKSEGNINSYYATKEITDALGIDSSAPQEIFDNATTEGEYSDAIRDLRYLRRYHAADKHDDIFAGNAPTEGKFYIYNVGRKQFLCGGADWGAHAALGFPGIEITLEAGEGATDGSDSFYFDSGLYNGDGHYMNYRGYMDCARVDDFAFIPVAGKENVYNIVQADYMDVHTAWNPYAITDIGNNDETTVGTEQRNLDPNDLNAQWKLVTRAERDALIANASIDNPIDVTYQMTSPNFNQREYVDDWDWNSGFSIWERGGNHYDFAAESYDSDEYSEMSQSVELPAGVYKVSVQGFYRNGLHRPEGSIENEDYRYAQPDLELAENAILMAGEIENDVYLANITAESGKAPGEGNDMTTTTLDDPITYNVPDGIVQATNFFKSGLYKTYTVVEHEGGLLNIGILKETKGESGDWIVADNFRIVYYGTETNKEAVLDKVSGVEDIELDQTVAPQDNRIFNLQGIQVSNPTVPGIYISNGKKFIVR